MSKAWDSIMQLQLNHTWKLGSRIGAGGFGQVFAASCGSEDVGPAVVKLVPKVPGADRELLFADLRAVRNVVPILDSGETDDHWVIVMPRAEMSLRQHLVAAGGKVGVDATIAVMTDICTALSDLEGNVVHRDLKPENVLLLNERWCL